MVRATGWKAGKRQTSPPPQGLTRHSHSRLARTQRPQRNVPRVFYGGAEEEEAEEVRGERSEAPRTTLGKLIDVPL